MANNGFGTKRNIDVVFCIDGTGSMTPCIENVKANARRFHMEFVNEMTTTMNSEIDSMRVKVIVFRDYKDDGDQAMVESRFFEMPDDQAEFDDFLAGISAIGGGDNPENGLEALYLAMKSDFTTGPKDRQLIVLFTDADALPLKDPMRTSSPYYPADMVDQDGFLTAWTCATQDSGFKLRDALKRMLIFAPDGTSYCDIAAACNRSIYTPVNPADGMKEIDFSKVIKLIAASASAKS